MKLKLAYIFIFIFALTIGAGAAVTQEKFTIRPGEQQKFLSGSNSAAPEATDDPAPSNVIFQNSGSAQGFPKMVFGQSNKYFKDIVTIQYQISLLKILNDRQKQNVEIAKAFKEIGLPYKEPPPSKSVCEEIPKNLLCITFYPEIYSDSDIAPINNSKEQISLQDMINQRPSPKDAEPKVIIHGVKKQKKKVAPKPKEPEVKVFDPNYKWMEITCSKGQCRALLRNTKTKKSMTVFQGDYIPSSVKDERIQVANIEFNKVTLMNQKAEIKDIRPALSPARGGPSSFLLNLKKDSPAVRKTSVNKSKSNKGAAKRSPLDQPPEEVTDVDVDELISELDASGDDIEIIDE